MKFEDCIKFANENPTGYVATIDANGHPRVRALLMWYADKTGFCFQTGTMKDIYGQLQKNPNVEVCFFNNKREGGAMLRVAGEIEFLNDVNLKKKAITDRPFLKAMGITAESSRLVIFRIPRGKAYFWTMETNFDPKKMIKFG